MNTELALETYWTPNPSRPSCVFSILELRKKRQRGCLLVIMGLSFIIGSSDLLLFIISIYLPLSKSQFSGSGSCNLCSVLFHGSPRRRFTTNLPN